MILILTSIIARNPIGLTTASPQRLPLSTSSADLHFAVGGSEEKWRRLINSSDAASDGAVRQAVCFCLFVCSSRRMSSSAR